MKSLFSSRLVPGMTGTRLVPSGAREARSGSRREHGAVAEDARHVDHARLSTGVYASRMSRRALAAQIARDVLVAHRGEPDLGGGAVGGGAVVLEQAQQDLVRALRVARLGVVGEVLGVAGVARWSGRRSRRWRGGRGPRACGESSSM